MDEREWPHSPTHRLGAAGAYMVTAATLQKRKLFEDARKLNLLTDAVLDLVRRYHWALEAWAIFPNHYHFVGSPSGSVGDARSLKPLLRHLHSQTARELNELDGTSGRRVWFQYWETHLTYERSYLARLNYVHQNAVFHGVVRVANQYRWCSAAWFERVATPAQVKTIYSFPTDRIQVSDDF